jgi:uncharacterized protein YcfL
MKKAILLLVAGALFASCSNEDSIVFYSSDESLMNAGDVYYVNLKISNN